MSSPRGKDKIGKCGNVVRNWSGPLDANTKFDSVVYNQLAGFKNDKITDVDLKHVYTQNNLSVRSPKLLELVRTIWKIDYRDHEKENRTYKHFIFSNSDNEHGAKLIASALQQMLDLKPIMEKTTGRVPVIKVGDGGDNHYGLLTPGRILKHEYEKDFKKKLLDKYNEDDNVYGKNMRFIILDGAYKEGINLRNVKYVHLFEPLPTFAQRKQAIARAIRYCSHQDMDFEVDNGWIVQIYMYKLYTPKDIEVEIYDPETDGYVKKTNVDLDELIDRLDTSVKDEYMSSMVDVLEAVGPVLSVDFRLTRQLIPKPNVMDPNLQRQVDEMYAEKTPSDTLAAHVRKTYPNAILPKPEVVNNCVFLESYLTNFQKYLASFFASSESRLGMLLWHSPGSGKTCTALNMVKKLCAASKYNKQKMCWATTWGLGKPDVPTECKLKDASLLVQHRTVVGTEAPDPKHYGRIYSYKTIESHLYHARNFDGMIVVFDEAHLLFTDELDASELLSNERLKRLRQSFVRAWMQAKKTQYPLRVILLSGTPVSTDPTLFFKMMNLIRHPDAGELPESLENLQERYGKDPKEINVNLLREDLDGYISFLDTSYDISRFGRQSKINVRPAYISMRDMTSDDVQLIDVNKKLENAEKRMKKTIKKYIQGRKGSPTIKSPLRSDFLTSIEIDGGDYFTLKEQQLEIQKRKSTRKISQDMSQQTYLERCKFLKPRQEDIDLKLARKEGPI
jgi:hypothetical protein